jgi:hypothetical protein
MLKELKYDEEMPKDFWNYKVNPILGYRYEPIGRNTNKEEKKYAMQTIRNKK